MLGASVCFASELSNSESGTIESIRKDHIETFGLIRKAYDGGDMDEVERLLNSLNQKPVKPATELEKRLRVFYRALINDEIIEAKELAAVLIEDNEVSNKEKAYVYKALGDYFLQRDDFDNAVIEYKKILELSGKKADNK